MTTQLKTNAKLIEENYVVTKLVECPYREKTNRYKRFQVYRVGKTVNAILADKRVTPDGFRRDVITGLVKIAKKATSH